MAQTGYTPISIYKTTTAAVVPSAANLVAGELAINLTDEKLYFKNAGGVVKLLAANLNTVPNGGTGVTTITGIVKGNGTAAMSAIVSGTDIKTINGGTLLGSGDLVVSGGLAATAIKTTAYTAVANDLVRVNSTAGAFTVTLPSAPADGDKVGLFDVANMCGTNAVLIAAAGTKTVEGDATGLSVNVNGAYVYLIYNSTGTNWKIGATPNALPPGANPSGTITGAAVNGSAVTYMRSDAVPALSLTIAQLNTAVTDADIATLAGAESLTNKNLSGCTADGTDAVGFRNIPQNSQSAAYTCVLADSGKHIFHPSGDVTARTYTIPANSSVAYPIGTAISFVNMTTQVVSIAITTDTMYLSSAGTTGTRSLAIYGSATALKITSTAWLISGSGLT